MRRWERIGAATGVAFVLCSAVAFLIVPDPPSPDDGSEFVLNFFAENESDVMWQAFFFGLGAVFLLWFAGALAVALRRAEGDVLARVPPIVAASAAASAAMFLVGVAASAAVASGVEGMDQGVGYGLYQLSSMTFVLTNFPAAAFVLSAAIGIGRSRLLPESVAWVGGVVALLLLVNAGGRLLADSAGFAPGGTASTIAFGAFLFWVFVASLFLVQRAAPARTAPES